MSLRRPLLLSCVVLLALASVGCTSARMEVPGDIASLQPWPVAGANPRTWNRPLQFGPWRTISVRERSTMSWGFEALGITTAITRRPYRLTLEGPEGEVREVACLTRDLTLRRGSFAVDATEIVSPRLACTIHGPRGEGPPSALVLGRRRNRLAGVLHTGTATYTVESVHRMAGARLTAADPVGYTVGRAGSTAAAVEVVNRGHVWIAPGAADDGGALAAAAAALLLFEPEIGPTP